MPRLAALLSVLLVIGRADEAVEIDVPDPLIEQRYEWARDQLNQELACDSYVRCDDVALNVLALSALGQFDRARQALTNAAQRSPLWVLASFTYWTHTADQDYLRANWQAITASVFSQQTTGWFKDDGVALAAIEGVLAMARALEDSATDARVRALHADTAQRRQVRLGIFAAAYGLLDADSARLFLDVTAAATNARYPLATGLLSLAFYKYHREADGFALLRSMAGAQRSTASMFVLPLLRGLIGWETDAAHHAATLEPHLPAGWESLKVSKLMVGKQRLDVSLLRDANSFTIQLSKARTGRPIALQIAPALPAGVRVRSVTVNDSDVPIHLETYPYDTHVVITTTLRHDLNIEIDYELPRNRPSLR